MKRLESNEIAHVVSRQARCSGGCGRIAAYDIGRIGPPWMPHSDWEPYCYFCAKKILEGKMK